MPFFSIVIPTYNRAHLISKTINSIQNQTFQDFEIIIVDDGSTDNTEEVIQPFLSENVFYYKKKNEERAVARNFGTQKAKGQYICWFDSDDIMYPEHLVTVHHKIKEKQYPEAIHTSFHIKKEDGTILDTSQNKSISANKNIISGNFLGCNSVFLKREIALLNPFNEDRDILVSEDWELWLRIAAQHPIYSIPQITYALIDHNARSVALVDKEKLILRFEKLKQTINSNSMVVTFLGKRINTFYAECHSYVALHLALTGKHKKEAFSYFLKSLKKDPAYLFKRRSLAIIKRVLL